jgi:hypothetical protein
MTELEKEKQALEDKIAEKTKEIADATHAVYWAKKRLKLVEAEMRERGEVAKNDADEQDEGLITK